MEPHIICYSFSISYQKFKKTRKRKRVMTVFSYCPRLCDSEHQERKEHKAFNHSFRTYFFPLKILNCFSSRYLTMREKSVNLTWFWYLNYTFYCYLFSLHSAQRESAIVESRRTYNTYTIREKGPEAQSAVSIFNPWKLFWGFESASTISL